MLQPMSNWFWFTDNRQLMLSMGDEWQCTTAYGDKHIVNFPETSQLFSLRDTEWYLSLGNSLKESVCEFSDAQLTHILINATAALQFHKPVTAKSWFFQATDNYGHHHRLSRINNRFAEGVVLVLTEEGPLSTVMLLSEHFSLNENKHLVKFDLIKLAKDRLEPLLTSHYSQLTA